MKYYDKNFTIFIACTSEQMNKGCCDPLINATLVPEWVFWDNGAGGSWTAGTDFIQFNIADPTIND